MEYKKYDFNGYELNVLYDENESYFNLKEVAEYLEIVNPKTSIDCNDEELVTLMSNSKVGSTYFRKLANRGEYFLTECGLCDKYKEEK